MGPYQGGGDMIESVTFEKTVYAQLPNKFEAGTPNIAGAIGLGAAIDYLSAIGFDSLMPHEADLLDYATRRLQEVPGLRIVGTAREKGSVISFLLEDPAVAPLDIGMRLDRDGIALRTGHHCCQPVMERMKIAATTRASFALYNTRQEIDALVEALRKIVGDARSNEGKPTADAATDSKTPFAKASADSPKAAAQELADNFEMLEDRDARNQYVLDLGARLPKSFDLLKQVTPRVAGCMSEVYLVPRTVPNTEDRLEFAADANAEIVRGLIAILQRLYSGHRAAAILAFDIEGFFHRIGLDQFISSQRRNGLAGMVQRIRGAAETLASRDRD